jgi:hypothetical protein
MGFRLVAVGELEHPHHLLGGSFDAHSRNGARSGISFGTGTDSGGRRSDFFEDFRDDFVIGTSSNIGTVLQTLRDCVRQVGAVKSSPCSFKRRSL